MTRLLVPTRKATQLLGVSACTLRRWAGEGKIRCEKPPHGHCLYDIDSLQLRPVAGHHVGTGAACSTSGTSSPAPAAGAIYARVSTPKQRPDLERQKQLLTSAHPGYRVFSDCASGINFKRPGLASLLEQIHRGTIKHVVATARDRICR
jgi:putative resolvase